MTPGLILGEWEESVEMGKKRGIMDEDGIETAGGHIGHGIRFAFDVSNGDWAGLGCPLEGRQATEEPSGSGALGSIGHAFGPRHGGCVVRPDAGPKVS